MIKLQLTRHEVTDMSNAMLPMVVRMLNSDVISFEKTKPEIGYKVCRAIMQELHVEMKRRELTLLNSTKTKITVKLREYQALILLDSLIRVPVQQFDTWRNTYRNAIISQLHEQV